MPLLTALNSIPNSGAPDPLRRVHVDGAYAQPVFSFGDPLKATVATVSINPSYQEFLTAKGAALAPGRQRFATPWLSRSPFTAAHVESIQADCNGYFHRIGHGGRRTFYGSWFRPMEALLNLSSRKLSYFSGDVCHLDLSPWASNPVWGGLNAAERYAHLALGVPVLLQQLGFPSGNPAAPRKSSIGKLLLNGKTTTEEVFRALAVTPSCTHQPPVLLTSSKGKTYTLEVQQGTVLGIDYVAWNIPLARPFGRQAMAHIAPLI
jgi:hypothetical protein